MADLDPGLTIYCDGLCEPSNPGGYGCWGWAAFDAQRAEVGRGYGCLGQGEGVTNNVAEYTAVLEALKWAWKHANGRPLQLRTDSKLVVEQANGRWACNSELLRPLLNRVRNGLATLGASLEWVSREQNTCADALSRHGYREARAGRALPFALTSPMKVPE